jgi:hypothetical protein
MKLAMLLAQVQVATKDTVEALRQGFGGAGGTRQHPYALVYFAGMLLAIAGGIYVWNRWLRPRRPTPEHARDYLALAALHLGLTPEQHADLARVAEAAGLTSPASMLLSPANMRDALKPELVSRVESLEEMLFGEPLSVQREA